MVEKSNTWPKKITVDKGIVKILSEQTYENFPNAIKELITNSYDADATKVSVIINLNQETIQVIDNGWGMSETEFNFYLRIAGRKRKKTNVSSSGRQMIGQFGIGFLSVFPFFKSFNIETKKGSSNEITSATIPCYQYFILDDVNEVNDIKIQGKIKYANSNLNESYTRITLSGFTDICKSFFYPSHALKNRKNSIHNWTSLEKLNWKLSEDLPISYDRPEFNNYSKEFSPNLPFEVVINDRKLLRPTYGKTILDQSINDIHIGDIKLKYFITTDKKAVIPNEAKYLKIRNLNAGVGERTNFGLGTEVGGARSRLNWLTGELIITEGLNNIISVSRDGFNFSPDYEKLKEYFVKKLTTLSNDLEREAEYEEFVNQRKEETKIKNLKYLKQGIVQGKLVKNIQPLGKTLDKNTTKVSVSNSGFEKKIKIRSKTFKVLLDSWDYKSDFFPAVIFKDNAMYINSKYPLFKGKKFTDIFIKIHVLLILSLEDKTVNRTSYKKMADEVLQLFKDYLK